MAKVKKVTLLTIFDGWGYREQESNNAIALANTPNWDHLWHNCSHTLLEASGESVGLPDGQMGNSEVGHITIGSGRVSFQDLTRINKDIETGKFFENKVFLDAINNVLRYKSKLHIVGLLSPGGVHSHQEHIFSLLELVSTAGIPVVIHAILDGRDVPPKSAKSSLNQLTALLSRYSNITLGTIAGRFYAMDRDDRFERTKLYYELLTELKASKVFDNSIEAIDVAYQQVDSDEFIEPMVVSKLAKEKLVVSDQDGLIFMNFRNDRVQQLCYAFLDPKFSGFARNKQIKFSSFVSLTEYATDISSNIAYEKPKLNDVLGAVLEKNNLSQLRIAETEKYAHVTFFFNGGKDQQFNQEDRVLIPSPKVATYDLEPQMSSKQVCESICTAIKAKKYDVIICNFANADMVGHSGNLSAAIKAVEALDVVLGQICEALDSVAGEMLLTADHGNVEQMLDEASGQPHTSHTLSLVPLLYYGKQQRKIIQKTGSLQDIAPTILNMLGIAVPKEMTGSSLLVE